MRLHSRGAHPPRLESPPLSGRVWDLILTCWVREASKRPGMGVVMVTIDSVLGHQRRDSGHFSSPYFTEASTTHLQPIDSVYYNPTSFPPFDMPQDENTDFMSFFDFTAFHSDSGEPHDSHASNITQSEGSIPSHWIFIGNNSCILYYFVACIIKVVRD